MKHLFIICFLVFSLGCEDSKDEVTTENEINFSELTKDYTALSTMSAAEASDRFNRSRNLWKAEGIVSEDLDSMLNALAVALWGVDAQLPNETDADRERQQELSELISATKESAETIRTDASISESQRKSQLNELLLNFMKSSGAKNIPDNLFVL
jgi:hypothetical protein